MTALRAPRLSPPTQLAFDFQHDPNPPRFAKLNAIGQWCCGWCGRVSDPCRTMIEDEDGTFTRWCGCRAGLGSTIWDRWRR